MQALSWTAGDRETKMATRLNPRSVVLALALLSTSSCALLSSAFSSALPSANSLLQEEDQLWELFDSWRINYSRSYGDPNSNNISVEEETMKRFGIFKANLDRITEHNGKQPGQSYQLGLTKFADLTHEEFRSMYLTRSLHNKSMSNNKVVSHPFKIDPSGRLPQFIDWRRLGAVTSPKDQGQCGSCWAFSTVAAVEAINQIVTGELLALSEQELVDCDREKNQGCSGGLMDSAFQFIINNGGLETEAEYPYMAMEGFCSTPHTMENLKVVTIDAFTDVTPNDERALLYAVSQQPVSVAIDASSIDFQLYSEGIFDGDCGTDLNHGVTLVGYGRQQGKNYWIVRNSWGEGWGEGGYFLLERGTDAEEGRCGVNMMPSYPVKLGPNPSRLQLKTSANSQSGRILGRKSSM